MLLHAQNLELSMANHILGTPVKLGRHTLNKRIVLPPLTRQRSAQPGDIATELMAAYYRQRAGAGFMVSEGTQIEPRGQGYAWTPGIITPHRLTAGAMSRRQCTPKAG